MMTKQKIEDSGHVNNKYKSILYHTVFFAFGCPIYNIHSSSIYNKKICQVQFKWKLNKGEALMLISSIDKLLFVFKYVICCKLIDLDLWQKSFYSFLAHDSVKNKQVFNSWITIGRVLRYKYLIFTKNWQRNEKLCQNK